MWQRARDARTEPEATPPSVEASDAEPGSAAATENRGLWPALFCAVFAAAAGTHALTPIFPELKEALGVSDGQVRLLTSVFTLGYSVSGFALGVQSDRVGRRAVLLGSLAVYALSNALLLTVDDYRLFLVLRALSGLGTGGITAAVIAASADAVSYERRGRVMSFVLAGSYAAVVLGIPVAALLARLRLTAVFGFLAAVTALALWLLWTRLPAGRGSDSARSRSAWALSRAALGARGALAALLTTGLNTVAAFAVIASLADHCVDRFGASLEQRTVLFLALGLGAIPGAWLAGRMSDGLGKRRSVLCALIGSIALTPLLLLPQTFATFLVPAVLVSLIQALRQGPFTAILTELAGDELRGSLVGWNSAFSGVGLALGTWVGGLTYAAYGLGGGVWLAMLALCGSLVLFGGFVPSEHGLASTAEASARYASGDRSESGSGSN